MNCMIPFKRELMWPLNITSKLPFKKKKLIISNYIDFKTNPFDLSTNHDFDANITNNLCNLW